MQYQVRSTIYAGRVGLQNSCVQRDITVIASRYFREIFYSSLESYFECIIFLHLCSFAFFFHLEYRIAFPTLLVPSASCREKSYKKPLFGHSTNPILGLLSYGDRLGRMDSGHFKICAQSKKNFNNRSAHLNGFVSCSWAPIISSSPFHSNICDSKEIRLFSHG